ncbi:MAG: hypothetical protein H3C63_17575 [Candidatus Omnitrophica bacterium]|nr:hypothetical protein [Candidatus Omnitrophota bacterium]
MKLRHTGVRNAAFVSLLVAAAVVGFMLMRALGPTERAEAQAGRQDPPIPQCMTYETPRQEMRTTCFSGPPPESGWYEPLLEAEREKPFFDGTLAGLRIGPNVEKSDTFCKSIGATDRDDRSVIEIAHTAGTPVEISPSYLPEGSEAVRTYAEQCGGIAYSATVDYWVPPDLSIPRWGGEISVYRGMDEATMGLAIAADRAETGEVAGYPAALFHPLTPEGFGYSAIVYSNGEVLTFLLGDGVSLDDLRKVAVSLEVGGTR